MTCGRAHSPSCVHSTGPSESYAWFAARPSAESVTLLVDATCTASDCSATAPLSGAVPCAERQWSGAHGVGAAGSGRADRGRRRGSGQDRAALDAARHRWRQPDLALRGMVCTPHPAANSPPRGENRRAAMPTARPPTGHSPSLSPAQQILPLRRNSAAVPPPHTIVTGIHACALCGAGRAAAARRGRGSPAAPAHAAAARRAHHRHARATRGVGACVGSDQPQRCGARRPLPRVAAQTAPFISAAHGAAVACAPSAPSALASRGASA